MKPRQWMATFGLLGLVLAAAAGAHLDSGIGAAGNVDDARPPDPAGR